MLYPLPAPYRGATHLYIYEVLVTPSESVRLTGTLGTVEADAFVPDPDLRGVVREIRGAEYTDGFRPFVNAQGAPGGNFRDADLAYWLTAYGHQDPGTWSAG